ncbi:MAG: dihydroneopterin aldolase [Candidatus Krumholzibacteriota bacterium]|nr:dihydroneopterin aldolase [Candidatus Krumholzibacteriota bacterium]
MLDEKITLRGITVFGYYGVSPMEREIGQKLEIDVEFHHDFTKAVETDALEDTINYERVYARVMDTVENNRFNLLETLGDRICGDIIERFPAVTAVTATVRKLTLPFPNNMSHVEVVVERHAD